MNVFVTVGTTPFNSLIRYVDQSNIDISNMVIQTSCSDYIPKNYESFSFVNDIERYYDEADVIITHAGAGTIYKLLEKNKKIIVFPNSDRIDKHQFEIAKFVYLNNYGLIGSVEKCLDEQLEKALNSNYSTYKKVNFFALDILSEYLYNEL